MSNTHYIEERNLSAAWGKALRLVSQPGQSEVLPLIVSITGFDSTGNVLEDLNFRNVLDTVLLGAGLQRVQTVASTIFPSSMWNPEQPRAQLFDRYKKMIPRLKKVTPRNNLGLYFQRMIAGGPQDSLNQLEYVLNHYLSRKGVRRSALQIAIFDPIKDHTAAPYLKFPCLQHVTFAPSANGGLSVNAFYATHYMVERAYGNYLGLCRLGQFVAHELGLKLERVTCYAGIAQRETTVSKTQLKPVFDAIDALVPPEEDDNAV